jgi:hypothetical protein
MIRRSLMALLGSVFVVTGAAASCGGGTTPEDPCAQLPAAPADTTVADPCRYWVAPPVDPNPVTACPATGHWNGSPLLGPTNDKTNHCRYAWDDPDNAPLATDVAALPSTWSSDCSYVTPQAQADDITKWGRAQLIEASAQPLAKEKGKVHVGVVVLDTAPESAHAPPSEAQHGQTLAWMIADLACQDRSDCAVSVKNALAMPRRINPQTQQPYVSPDGGSFGVLSDVAESLWAEARSYRDDLKQAAIGAKPADSVPARIVVISAFGYDNIGTQSLCDTNPALSGNEAVRAMHEAYEAAACLGMMHVAAAGNSSGGPDPQGGLLCPARWESSVKPSATTCAALWGPDWTSIEQDYAKVMLIKYPDEKLQLFTRQVKDQPTDALMSVAGVDYHGSPLVLSRPFACAEAVAIGIGGVGWEDEAQAPPFLFGTSVSAAVAGAGLAVRWRSALPSVATDLVQTFKAENSPIPFERGRDHCDSPAGVISCPSMPVWLGKPVQSFRGQNPPMPDALKSELNSRGGVENIAPPGDAVCAEKIPHCVRPSVASTSDVWPQPVEPVCVKCGIYLSPEQHRGYPVLWLDGNTSLDPAEIQSATLIIESRSGVVLLTKQLSVRSLLAESTIVLDEVRASLSESSAWISVYLSRGQTVSQQIFVIE